LLGLDFDHFSMKYFVKEMMCLLKLPPENIYAHTKKLVYLLSVIEKYARRFSQSCSTLSLLDFGCGNGAAVSQYLIKSIKRGEYLGVDIHEPSLNYAQRIFGDAHPSVRFMKHIPDNYRFDIIVYADILEHLAEPGDILVKHHTMLKDDGCIVGAIPNGYGPFEIEKRIDRWLGLSWLLQLIFRLKRLLVGARHGSAEVFPYNMASGHVQFFTKKALFTLLHNAGFEVVDFRNGAFLGAPISERFLLRSKTITKWNAKVAEYLPSWMVSTWYFTAVKLDMGHN